MEKRSEHRYGASDSAEIWVDDAYEDEAQSCTSAQEVVAKDSGCKRMWQGPKLLNMAKKCRYLTVYDTKDVCGGGHLH